MIFSTAIAQEAAQTATKAAAEQPQQSPLMTFMPFIVIFVIFYFLMIRPQKKKMEKEKKMLGALGKGDEIFTKSGMMGTIMGLNDKIATIQVSEGVNIKILRGEVGGLAKNILETQPQK